MLAYGIVRGTREPRLASAALVMLSTVKVFLYDLMGTGGLWRALSVICLGAVLIGAYGDRAGRKAALTLTIWIMAAGTLLIAVAPGYGSIGVLAPWLLLLGRLLQGFSAGVELGGVSSISPKWRRRVTRAFM